MEYPISLDTALSIVGSLKIKKMKELHNVKDKEDIQLIEQEIDMLREEENTLYKGNELQTLSIMDKVVRLYSPIIKKLNGF